MANKIIAQTCPSDFMRALNDTLDVITGKWKLQIIGSLVNGKKRFKEIENSITKINPRMLSKELKDLESTGIVTRTVYSTMPVSVEYELTEAGHSLEPMLQVMVEWGKSHRQRIIGKIESEPTVIS